MAIFILIFDIYMRYVQFWDITLRGAYTRMEIDDLNMAIIRHLRDGRKSFKEISTDLSVTENTIRSRVNRMVEEGVLEITGLINTEKIPGHRTIMVGVKLGTMDLVSKGEEFSHLKGVVSVNVTTGQYDLILTVLLTEEYDLLQFYTAEVSKISDVRSVETFVVYKSYNAPVPYVL